MKFKRYLIFLAWSVGAIIALLFISNLFIYIIARPYIYKNIEDVPETQVVLIPGAAVNEDGKLSPIFEERANRAALLYKVKKVSKILVSGDNSTDSYNEVNPVRNYLLGKGIPDQDIFLDHAGFDTYSTMYRARDIFQVSSAVVSTQSFHLPRSIFLARALGMDVYGVSANEEPARLKNYVREIFANQKAILNLAFNRQPKFLGKVVPITGPGQNYGGFALPLPLDSESLPDVIPPNSAVPGECFIGGCSSQICSEEEGVVSTCEYREEYACYKNAKCERQTSGECGWTPTKKLTMCLDSAGDTEAAQF